MFTAPRKWVELLSWVVNVVTHIDFLRLSETGQRREVVCVSICCSAFALCKILTHGTWVVSVNPLCLLFANRRAIWRSSELLPGKTSTKLMPRMTSMVSLYDTHTFFLKHQESIPCWGGLCSYVHVIWLHVVVISYPGDSVFNGARV